MTALQIAEEYYERFNRKDYGGMLELVHPEIVHFPNQGGFRRGKAMFAEFLKDADLCYTEHLTEFVFYTEPSNDKIAVQFMVNGIYNVADKGMPLAHGQAYVLPVAAFLEFREGLISRITTYYNLARWLQLVGR